MNEFKDNITKEIQRLEEMLADAKKQKDTEKDPQLQQMFEEEISNLLKQKADLESSLSAADGNYESSADENGVDINPNVAILEVRAGTGGDEAGLFAKDLLEMYERFGERSGWKIEEIFRSENEVDGIKTVTVEIRGKNVYELLKNESGVHRVQRVPTTESAGRIHTSTATVAVLPEVKKVNIEIKPDDLKWEFFRAGGNGGQNVNKVSTAVRLTHLPTGEIVECKEERYQGKNREKALSMLKSRLFTSMQEQQVKSITDLRSTQIGSAERSEKIRTYNYPQDRITDHRLNESWHSMKLRMAGDIEDILTAVSKIGKDNELVANDA